MDLFIWNEAVNMPSLFIIFSLTNNYFKITFGLEILSFNIAAGLETGLIKLGEQTIKSTCTFWTHHDSKSRQVW